METTLSQTLADHVAALRWEQLPEACQRGTRSSLLDMLGCMLAATGLEPACKAFADLAKRDGGEPQATAIGYGFRTSASRAALVNGSLTHALDFEDGLDGLPVHANASSIPAALAIAEMLPQVTGKQLLTALAAGCDLSCRLAAALDVNPDDAGWYTPPIMSLLGATASACHLLRLNSEQILNAWSLALCQGTCSGELKRAPQSDLRAVREGFIARAAVDSALLAAGGVRGFPQPIESKGGLFGLYAQGKFSAERLLKDLGTDFYGARLSFKAWPSCRGTHAYIEALKHILQTSNVSVEEIENIEVEVGPIPRMLMEPRPDKLRPSNAINAKFSIPYTLAVTLRRGTVRLDDFNSAALEDPATLVLTPLVTMKYVASLGPTEGVLTVRTRRDSITYAVKYPPGSPENPLAPAVLAEKFVDCAVHAIHPWAREKAERACHLILSTDKIDDVQQELMTPLFSAD
jgi:2-methylcitrate dehydratase PrpD